MRYVYRNAYLAPATVGAILLAVIALFGAIAWAAAAARRGSWLFPHELSFVAVTSISRRGESAVAFLQADCEVCWSVR